MTIATTHFNFFNVTERMKEEWVKEGQVVWRRG
jgi:hypothetical protein